MNPRLALPLTALLIVMVSGCSKGPAMSSAAGKEDGTTTEQPDRQAEASDAFRAAITPETADRVGIGVLTAGPAEVRETLLLYGLVRPNAYREQDIRARYPGVVRSVRKRVGDSVAPGDVLLTVESNESLQVYSIRSPIGGQVLERATNPGEAVDGSAVLMRVADFSTVWAEFAVFAQDIGRVRPGMRVVLHSAQGDETTDAKISYLAPAGSLSSQSVMARATVDNRDGRWVPGQFVTGDVVLADARVRVAVKPAALQDLNGKTVVFVQTGQSFTAQPVLVGKRSAEAVEIVRGLAAGERYAAVNSYLIKADLLKGEADED